MITFRAYVHEYCLKATAAAIGHPDSIGWQMGVTRFKSSMIGQDSYNTHDNYEPFYQLVEALNATNISVGLKSAILTMYDTSRKISIKSLSINVGVSADDFNLGVFDFDYVEDISHFLYLGMLKEMGSPLMTSILNTSRSQPFYDDIDWTKINFLLDASSIFWNHAGYYIIVVLNGGMSTTVFYSMSSQHDLKDMNGSCHLELTATTPYFRDHITPDKIVSFGEWLIDVFKPVSSDICQFFYPICQEKITE